MKEVRQDTGLPTDTAPMAEKDTEEKDMADMADPEVLMAADLTEALRAEAHTEEALMVLRAAMAEDPTGVHRKEVLMEALRADMEAPTEARREEALTEVLREATAENPTGVPRAVAHMEAVRTDHREDTAGGLTEALTVVALTGDLKEALTEA
jgi:hypothetical protein